MPDRLGRQVSQRGETRGQGGIRPVAVVGEQPGVDVAAEPGCVRHAVHVDPRHLRERLVPVACQQIFQ
ncbi:MAG: hypothetical protein J0H99_21630, partial [Rhodospirillales bacterium]|nr:hypothetical protein [Rhodospirillales bacterium]